MGKKCNDFGQDLDKGENIKQMVENLREFADCLNEKVKRLIKTTKHVILNIQNQ